MSNKEQELIDELIQNEQNLSSVINLIGNAQCLAAIDVCTVLSMVLDRSTRTRERYFETG